VLGSALVIGQGRVSPPAFDGPSRACVCCLLFVVWSLEHGAELAAEPPDAVLVVWVHGADDAAEPRLDRADPVQRRDVADPLGARVPHIRPHLVRHKANQRQGNLAGGSGIGQGNGVAEAVVA
jgi:hypothetical protein